MTGYTEVHGVQLMLLWHSITPFSFRPLSSIRNLLFFLGMISFFWVLSSINWALLSSVLAIIFICRTRSLNWVLDLFFLAMIYFIWSLCSLSWALYLFFKAETSYI